MSIRKMIEQKIQDMRLQIAIWDNPASTSEARGQILAVLVGDDSRFWAEVAKRATAKPPKAMTKAQIEKAVGEMKTVAEPPAPKTTTITLEAAPASKPVKPATPAPATTAPRVLAPVQATPEQKKNKLVSILSGFIEANKRIDGEKTRRLLSGVVNSSVAINEEEAALVLRAARKANDTGFHLIDRNSADIFYCASVEAVDAYVFGQDGEIVQIFAGLSETKGEISPKLAARIFVLMTAISSLKEHNALREFELSRIEALQVAVAKIGYQKIEDGLYDILRAENELEKIHREAQVSNHALASIASLVLN